MNTKDRTDGRRLDETDAKPINKRAGEHHLSWDEHIAMAKMIYALTDALRSFQERYRKSHYAYSRVRGAERCLDELRSELDSAFCSQFSENPRPADPDFMDSPYYSAVIQGEACVGQPIKED